VAPECLCCAPTPATTWARACDAPLLICGIAGSVTEATCEYRGEVLNFGGGGSGMFWPEGREWQAKRPGVVTVDLKARTAGWVPLADPAG